MAETSVQVPTKSLAVWATTTIGEIIPIISAVRASMTISFFDIVSHQYQGPLQMRDFLHDTGLSAMRKLSSWRRGCQP